MQLWYNVSNIENVAELSWCKQEYVGDGEMADASGQYVNLNRISDVVAMLGCMSTVTP